MAQNHPCDSISARVELESRTNPPNDQNLKKVFQKLKISKAQNANKGKCRFIPRRYVVAIMAFFSFFIINCQRINLSMALVAMGNQTELSNLQTTNYSSHATYSEKEDFVEETYQEIGSDVAWSVEMQSHIQSASFLGFVLTNIPGGRLSETVGAKEVLIFSLVCASLSNIFSPLLSNWSAYALLGIQFVKGLAQGSIQPALSSIMALWFPTLEKSFLSSAAMSGYPVGAIIGGILSGALCDSSYLGGWPSVFYLFGFSGLILAVFIFVCLSNSPEEDGSILISELKYIISYRESVSEKDTVIPWKKMLSSSATWAVFVGMFGQFWVIFYFLSVHPIYLGAVMHYSNTESGYLNSFPYIGQVIVIWASSYASDWSIRRKFTSVNMARKFCNSLSCIGFSLGLIGLVFANYDPLWNVILVVVAISATGFGYPGSCIVPLDMTNTFAGTLMGIACTVASTSGFIMPLVVGLLTNNQNESEQWNKVFYMSSGVALGSGIIFNMFGSSDLQKWEAPVVENREADKGVTNEGFEETIVLPPSSIPQQDIDKLPVFSVKL